MKEIEIDQENNRARNTATGEVWLRRRGESFEQLEARASRRGKVDAPWSPDQVASLNAYQDSGRFHPFTGKRKENGDETVLIATTVGWTETPRGPIVQTWAHDFMADWSWDSELLKRADRVEKSS